MQDIHYSNILDGLKLQMDDWGFVGANGTLVEVGGVHSQFKFNAFHYLEIRFLVEISLFWSMYSLFMMTGMT
jgi:hypothetical protein